MQPRSPSTRCAPWWPHVDRLCEDGALAFRRLPGARHRRIRVQDILDVVGEREARHTGGDALRAAIADAGLDEE